MKPERAFLGRPLARHCAELLTPARIAPGADNADTLSFPTGPLARALSTPLARLMGGAAAKLSCAEPMPMTAGDFATRVGPLGANVLFAVGPGEATVCVSIAAEGVFRLLDRAFGGRGDVSDPLPGEFPLSSELLIERVNTLIAEALAVAIQSEAPLRVLGRDVSIARLAPFPADEPLIVHELVVNDPDRADARWSLLVTHTQYRHARAHASSASAPIVHAGDPEAAPFADIPLGLRAVLVDMRVPLSRLAALAVGDVLPVAVARNVPLCAGDRAIAAGTVGALDDRAALRLTQAF